MSGLVGQVGARSGVVGSTTDSTQLDYEEGTWTPTLEVGTISSPITARYVKIGNQVTLWIETFTTPTSSSGATQSMESLPFVIGDTSASGAGVGGGFSLFRGVKDSSYAYFYASNANTPLTGGGSQNNTVLGWTLTYQTVT